MRYDRLHSGRGPSAAPSRAFSPDAMRGGALLRALLAGAVALLVLLLPGQLAASRHHAGAMTEAWVLDAGAAAGCSQDQSRRSDGISPGGHRQVVG